MDAGTYRQLHTGTHRSQRTFFGDGGRNILCGTGISGTLSSWLCAVYLADDHSLVVRENVRDLPGVKHVVDVFHKGLADDLGVRKQESHWRAAAVPKWSHRYHDCGECGA